MLGRALCAVVAVVAICLEPSPTAACSCAPASSPAEAFTEATDVFVGTVGAITKIDGSVHHTTFAVREVFKGTVKHTAVIRSNWDGASCDYRRFTQGEHMLVYAHHYKGHLYVSGCSGTQPITLTSATDLLFLRGLANRKTGWVWGDVSFFEVPSMLRANVEVVARGTKYATRTNVDGSYRLELPPGTYVVEPRHPDPRFALDEPVKPIELVVGDEVFQYFTYQWNGRIRGRVVDSRRRSAANVTVAALISDPKNNGNYRVGATATSDASGRYEIDLLPEGKYVVAAMLPADDDDGRSGLPTTYYPGVRLLSQARAVEVGHGSISSSIDFTVRLPRLFVLSVVVRVVKGESGGRQGDDEQTVRVMFENARERRSDEVYANGHRVSFRETAGSVLTVRVCHWWRDSACSKPVTVTLDRNRTVELTLP